MNPRASFHYRTSPRKSHSRRTNSLGKGAKQGIMAAVTLSSLDETSPLHGVSGDVPPHSHANQQASRCILIDPM